MSQSSTRQLEVYPTLMDRVKALGMVHVFPKATEQHSGQGWFSRFFGNDISSASLSSSRAAKKHSNQYTSILARKKRLLALEKRPHQELTQEEHWELAVFSEMYRAYDNALAQYQAYHRRFPDDDQAAFSIGRLQLAKGDEAGLFKLTRASRNPKLAEKACGMAYKFLMKKGRNQEADFWRTRGLRQKEINKAANKERASVDVADVFEAPALPLSYIHRVAKLISAHPKVDQVWLAQKKVKYFPEDPVAIFAVSLKGFTFNKDKVLEEVLKTVRLDHSLFGVVKGGRNEGIYQKVLAEGIRVK